MQEKQVVEEIVQTVASVAPHISSGLMHRREYVGEQNPSQEKQMEADVWANEILKEELTSIEGVGEFASEEEETITECGEGLSVTVDPLDGSSNIPTNNLVGTIVGIYDAGLPAKGAELVAAFYVVYGPLTTMMFSDGDQVNEYVIEEKQDDSVEMVLASEDIEIDRARVYGFGGNRNWTEEFREFESEIQQEHKLRYGGAFVGDINQVMHHGGMFAYPERTDAPNGKLRLLFEANPVAFIVENAGGASSDGDESILEVEPGELHQRVPLHVGHPDMVEKLEKSV
ncbi:MAG: class 1 fructose-bisphosphatase [Candidatus Nanohaloarchaea archaeon]